MMCEPEHACMTTAYAPPGEREAAARAAAEFAGGREAFTMPLPQALFRLRRAVDRALAAASSGRITGETEMFGVRVQYGVEELTQRLNDAADALGPQPTGQRTSTGPVTPAGPTPNGSYSWAQSLPLPRGYSEAGGGQYKVWRPQP